MRSFTVVLLAVLVLAGASQATVTSYPLYRTAVAPVVDGDVAGDPAWQTIPAATGFRVLGGDYAQAKQTTVRLCWGDEALYVAFVAEEPDAALLKPAAGDGGATWAEDSLELFLQPRPPTGQTYQIGVTCGGAKGSGEGYPDIAKVQTAARIGNGFYAIEARVPWGVVDAQPQVGAKWRGTVCRNIFTTRSGGDKFTSLSPLQSRFLEPDNFATLTFMAEKLDQAQAQEISEGLNREYRASLLDQLAQLAASGKQYEETLRSARQDVKYGAEARDLLRSWQRLERLEAHADKAPTDDIRAGLLSAQGLGQRSYELKYRILLRQLMLD